MFAGLKGFPLPLPRSAQEISLSFLNTEVLKGSTLRSQDSRSALSQKELQPLI